jgi:hypothetical protein
MLMYKPKPKPSRMDEKSQVRNAKFSNTTQKRDLMENNFDRQRSVIFY